MSLIGLIVLLIVLGIVLFFAQPYIHPKLFTVIVILVGLGVAVWLLQAFGVWSGEAPSLR